MEGSEKKNNELNNPRAESFSGGGSFAEIAREKEAKKANGQQLDAILRKIKDDKAHLIIAALLLIIATIFLFLSWRFNSLKERVFVPVSMQFITSCVCYAAGLGFGVWGLAGMITHNNKAAKLQAES